MANRVLLWFLLLCAAVVGNLSRILAAPGPIPRALSTCVSNDQRAFVSRMYALFEIVSPEYAKKGLSKVSDYPRFRRRIDDWQKANPEWWNETERRLNYCDSLRQIGGLGTDIDDPYPDVRWALILTYGIPEYQIVLPGRCNQKDTSCTVWLLIWPARGSGHKGQEIACWSAEGKGYPAEIIKGTGDFPLAYPLWPFVNYSQFPNGDGTVDLWFSIWVPGNQFSGPTLDGGQLKMRIDLYESDGITIVQSREDVSNLQIVKGVLEALESQDRSSIRAMGYLSFSGLKPGRYSARLTIIGDRDNSGQNWITVDVRDNKISDLLILGQNCTSGESGRLGITRSKTRSLYDNPECTLLRKGKIDLYFEARLPEDHSPQFQVSATLLRLPEVVSNRSSAILFGDPIVVADSLGRPFLNGEWHSPRNQKYLDSLAKSGGQTSGVVTLFTESRKASNGMIPISVHTKLGSNIKSGKYMLSVVVNDAEKNNCFLSARRVIRVVSNEYYSEY